MQVAYIIQTIVKMGLCKAKLSFQIRKKKITGEPNWCLR
uniref:Uncharacterized protein n=1 Tax=Arundo donax TaxID=35708 RepID=A0A0A9CBJ1_ARUDO